MMEICHEQKKNNKINERMNQAWQYEIQTEVIILTFPLCLCASAE